MNRRKIYFGGDPHICWIHYHSDGKTMVRQQEYVDGQLHGLSAEWYSSQEGVVGESLNRSTINYRMGKHHGESRCWYRNAQTSSIENYSYGKRTGSPKCGIKTARQDSRQCLCGASVNRLDE